MSFELLERRVLRLERGLSVGSIAEPYLGSKNIMYRFAKGANAAQIDDFGVPAITSTGGTAQAFAATNLRTYMRRVQFLTAGAANASIGWRFGALTHLIEAGAAPDIGGFRATCRFGFSNVTSPTGRWFIGFIGQTAAIGAAANPSDSVNMLGVGMDSGDPVMQVMHNDSAGIATKHPCTQVYSTETYYQMDIVNAIPTGGFVTISLKNLLSGVTDSFAFTTDLPIADVLLGWHHHANSGASGAGGLVLALDFTSMWIQADY